MSWFGKHLTIIVIMKSDYLPTVMLCIGKVVKYAASSAAGLCDQLYHIEWEDGVSEWVSREAIQ